MGNLYILTASLATAIFMSALDTSIVNVVLPGLVTIFDTSFAAVQWVLLGYLLSLASTIVGVGSLGDLFGKKRIYLIGLGLFTIASGLCGLSTSIYMLIFCRILQGFGAAVIMALTFAIAQDAIPKDKITATMTLITAMLSMGFAVGPTLGGFLIEWLGWEYIFFVNIPLGLFVMWGISRHLQPLIPTGTASFDTAGMMLLGGTLMCYIAMMTVSQTDGFLSLPVLVFGLLFFGGLGGFLLLERRKSSPLIELPMFRNKLLSSSLSTSVLVYSCMTCTQVLAAFFLAGVNGFSEFEIGLSLSVGPVVTMLLGFTAGFLCRFFSKRHLMLTGLIIMVFGSLAMTTLPPSDSLLPFCWRLACINGGLALFQTPNNIMTMANAAAHQRGVVSALLALSRTIGQITGAAVMSSLFSLFLFYEGTTYSTASQDLLVSSYHQTFSINTAYMILTVLIVWWGIRENRKNSLL